MLAVGWTTSSVSTRTATRKQPTRSGAFLRGRVSWHHHERDEGADQVAQSVGEQLPVAVCRRVQAVKEQDAREHGVGDQRTARRIGLIAGD